VSKDNKIREGIAESIVSSSKNFFRNMLTKSLGWFSTYKRNPSALLTCFPIKLLYFINNRFYTPLSNMLTTPLKHPNKVITASEVKTGE